MGRWRARTVIACCLTLWASGRVCGAVDEGAVAEAVLRASDVRAGLVAHLGCGDGKLTAALGRGRNLIVHGLAADAAGADEARRHIRAAGLYGQVSAEAGPFAPLPYADDLVNLVVVDRLEALLKAGLSLAEIMRVLSPGGTACIGEAAGGGAGLSAEGLKALLGKAGIDNPRIVSDAGEWAIIRKPRPRGMDEWTHERHGPDGNSASADVLAGPPTGPRWIAGPVVPIGARKQSVPVALSAGGRNFYFMRDTTGRTSVLARDAFNGLRLWERTWTSQAVAGHSRNLFDPKGDHTPGAQMPMAASADRLFALVDDRVAALDALTGKTLATFTGGIPQDILYSGTTLVCSTAAEICGFEAATGRRLWQRPARAVDAVTDGKRVFFLDLAQAPPRLICLLLASGEQRWAAEAGEIFPQQAAPARARTRAFGLRFCTGELVVLIDGSGIHALSAEDGKRLWTCKTAAGKSSANQHTGSFFFAGLIWVARGGAWEALDPATGQVKRSVKGARAGGCQSISATERYFLQGRSMSFVEVAGGKTTQYAAARGPCAVGLMPANGLIYTHSHACGCFAQAIYGFQGLASAPGGAGKTAAPRLEKGPAYGDVPPPPAGGAASDWPGFRRDGRRGGASAEDLPAALKVLWEADLARAPAGPAAEDWATNPIVSGPLTGPVIVGETVFVALPDAHGVAAVDAATGRQRWVFTAGGRVDSPPTIHDGLCLFGSRDGWVYCLRASDGALAWRFRAAPAERRIVAFGQLESSWPVAGSVLIEGGRAFVAAGRNAGADGGPVVYALEPATGKVLWEKPGPAGFAGHVSVMVSDGAGVYLGTCRFDPATGAGGPAKVQAGGRREAPPETPAPMPPTFLRAHPFGLLDRTWTRYAIILRKGMSTWHYGSAEGQLLAFNDTHVFGYRYVGSQVFGRPVAGQEKGWSVQTPGRAEALVLAGGRVYVAGRPAPAGKQAPAGGAVWVLSAEDGAKAAELSLPAPAAYDGLAAAAGRLYVATQDGKLLAFGQ